MVNLTQVWRILSTLKETDILLTREGFLRVSWPPSGPQGDLQGDPQDDLQGDPHGDMQDNKQDDTQPFRQLKKRINHPLVILLKVNILFLNKIKS